MPSTIEELEKIKKECLKMSSKRALLSAIASVVPVPFTDVATDVVLLKKIIPVISEKFGLSKDQIDEYNPQLAIFIYEISKRLGMNMIGKYVTKELIVQILKKMGVKLTTKQVIKYIPVFGQVISAGVSFSAMRIIINAHIDECYKVVKAVIMNQRIAANKDN